MFVVVKILNLHKALCLGARYVAHAPDPSTEKAVAEENKFERSLNCLARHRENNSTTTKELYPEFDHT